MIKVEDGEKMSFVKNRYWPKPVMKRGFFTSFDQSGGVMSLVKWAIREENLRDIDSRILLERMPLIGNDVRELYLRVEPFLKGETIDMAVQRLVRAGHILEGTGELAGFLGVHSSEVAKWRWVFAMRQKMWMYMDDVDGKKRVSGASAEGKHRRLWRCFHPDLEYDSRCGIIVSSPAQ
jgi:hypothetical protein